MLFGPRARRCEHQKHFRLVMGYLRGPPVAVVCCDHDAQGMSGFRRRVLRCCIAAIWLLLWRIMLCSFSLV